MHVFCRLCSLTQNFGDTKRIYKMSSSKPTDNGLLQIFTFLNEQLYEALQNCFRIFNGYLIILQLLRFW